MIIVHQRYEAGLVSHKMKQGPVHGPYQSPEAMAISLPSKSVGSLIVVIMLQYYRTTYRLIKTNTWNELQAGFVFCV